MLWILISVLFASSCLIAAMRLAFFFVTIVPLSLKYRDISCPNTRVKAIMALFLSQFQVLGQDVSQLEPIRYK
jgi:hypothetical protein